MSDFDLTFNPERESFDVEVRGEVTGKLLDQVRDQIKKYGEEKERFSIFVNLTDADLKQFNHADINYFQAAAFKAKAKRMSVLVKDKFQFGMARQFFGHADPSQGYELLVTQDAGQAVYFSDLSQELK